MKSSLILLGRKIISLALIAFVAQALALCQTPVCCREHIGGKCGPEKLI